MVNSCSAAISNETNVLNLLGLKNSTELFATLGLGDLSPSFEATETIAFLTQL